MSAYWWECEKCGKKYDFNTACKSPGIAHYIRDALVLSKWDQALLLIECPNCHQKSLRIFYEFPRKEKELLKVIHIVGLGEQKNSYIPMMWETSPFPFNDIWFDFKYINNRNIWGLNKPAIFCQNDLRELFELYCKRTGKKSFP